MSENLNKKGNNKTHVITPHAAFVVWNFQDSLSSWSVGEVGNKNKDKGSSTTINGINTIHETVISTMSLKSISTQKQKGAPVGQFTIQLAPTKNWIAALTPGSWCAVLISNQPITQKDTQFANSRKLKMFGKIISVRSNVTVDQASGARMTSYTVIGEDWGHIWMNNLYIDERAVNPAEETAWNAATLKIDEALRKTVKTGLPSTSDIVKVLIDLWGDATEKIVQPKDLMLSSGPNFTLPPQVARFLSVDPSSGVVNAAVSKTVTKISDVVNNDTHRKFGVLTGYDTYTDFPESVGVIRPTELNGARSIWQVLHQVCNPVLNELVTDLDFDNGKPRLRLWKRIRPFVVDKNNEPVLVKDDYMKNITSEFTNLKRYEIPMGHVLAVDCGTNWRDKYNFIEIRIDASQGKELSERDVKANSQVYDGFAFQREGFRPLIMTSSNFIPISESLKVNYWDVVKWKYLLKEWYFDTHRMLNGSMTIIGQDHHIPVGSNIMVDAQVFNHTGNLNEANRLGKATHVLAHVEGVAHAFQEQDGSRSFVTTINFVRGILVDKNGKVVGKQDMALKDKDASKSTSLDDTNRDNIFGSSGDIDFDPYRLKDKK